MAAFDAPGLAVVVAPIGCSLFPKAPPPWLKQISAVFRGESRSPAPFPHGPRQTDTVLGADSRPAELSSHFDLSSFSLAPRWGEPGATDASQWSIASTVNRQSLPTRNAGN